MNPSIVKAVTKAINQGADQHWSVDYYQSAKWDMSYNGFVLDKDPCEKTALHDILIMRSCTNHKGRARHLAEYGAIIG